MTQKKPAILLSSCNFFASLNSSCSPQQSRTSPFKPHRSRPERQRPWHQSHRYATAASDTPRDPHQRPPDVHNEPEPPQWPVTESPSKVPTPYQILNCSPGAAYSKHHFYRLVKLYHPDRFAGSNGHHSHASSPSAIHALPHHVRLERYRLIVTAHTILSHPTKRRLYDEFGSGWVGQPERPTSAGSRPGPDYAPPRWPPGESPMHNATWEDWEDWYQRQWDRQQREEQEEAARGEGRSGGGGGGGARAGPLMNNYAFVSLVAMFAALGGLGQAKRAEAFGARFQEQQQAASERAHGDLMRARERASSGGRSRAERVSGFLTARDGAAWADGRTRSALGEPDVCCAGERVGGGEENGRDRAAATKVAG